MTYLRTWDGWVYLATVIDAHSRRVIGWAIAAHMKTDLIQDALEIAVAEYFDWFNQRRLHGELGHIPPIEAETNFYTHQPAITQRKRA